MYLWIPQSQVAWITADYKVTFRSLDPSDPNYWETRSKVHLRSAERLYDVCCHNGGIFIKVGQHLGALDYLLPKEYTKTFKRFHNNAPEMSLDTLKTVLQEDLGKKAEDIFDTIEAEPLGAASLAQCHKARLKDGRLVAVKVQFPSVRTNAETDLKAMEFLVSCVSYFFPTVQFQWLASEVKRNLPVETDFTQEAQNIEKFATTFRHLNFVKAPTVYWEWTTPRVLTMEYMDGGKVDDRGYMDRHGIPTTEVSQKIAKLYSEMIFFRGYVHCDPHPGNVLVRKSDRGHVEVVLLDHGLYTELNEEFRLTYCHLWLSILNHDTVRIKKYALELKGGELYPLLTCIIAARSWDSISKGVDASPVTNEERRQIQLSAIEYFQEITQILNSVPRELLLILKTNDLIRCIEHSLGTHHNKWAFIEMTSNCVRALGEHRVKTARGIPYRMYYAIYTRIQLLFISLYKMYAWLSGNLLHTM